MKTSELITQLEELKKSEGDIEVCWKVFNPNDQSEEIRTVDNAEIKIYEQVYLKLNYYPVRIEKIIILN